VRINGASQIQPGTIPYTQLVITSNRLTAQVAAAATVVSLAIGAADATLRICADVNVTVSTTHSFSVEVDYTDETNTARTLTLPMIRLAGSIVTLITDTTGVGPYSATSTTIRCKAGTTATMKTLGTFTTVTYNVEGSFEQLT
jgi:hypothetical protein